MAQSTPNLRSHSSFSSICLSGSFGLSRFSGRKTSQTSHAPYALRFTLYASCASLTDLPEQGVGDRMRLAPSPFVASLPRRSERKPSGIPSVTVVPTVILQSVPAFLLRTPGGGPATAANVADRTRSPQRGEGSQPGPPARRSFQRSSSPLNLRFSGHVRETQRHPRGEA